MFSLPGVHCDITPAAKSEEITHTGDRGVDFIIHNKIISQYIQCYHKTYTMLSQNIQCYHNTFIYNVITIHTVLSKYIW